MTPRRLIEPARLAGGAVLRTQSDERLVDLVELEAGTAEDALALVHDGDVPVARLAALKAALVADGTRVRLARRTKNTKPLLDALAADGFTRFAFVDASSTPDDLTRVRAALEGAGFELESVGLAMVAKTTVAIEEESTAKQVVRLVEGLEDNDDVQDVYANFDIPEAVLEAVAS